MALKFDYNNSTKAELLAEVNARKEAGRNLTVGDNSNKADLAAALTADDAAAEQGDPTGANTPPPASAAPATMPKMGLEDYQPNSRGWDPADQALYKDGEFRKKVTRHPEHRDRSAPVQGDGEVYSLHLEPDDLRGNTHHLKNKDHTWKGSKEQFEDAFEEARD